jgi:peptide/nickel transport system substrate-binding protein
MFIKRDLSISRREFARAVVGAAAGIAGSSKLGWAAAPRDRVVVAMSVGIDSVNPYAHSDSPLYGLWGHIMESLVDTDYERKNFSPELATAWSPKGNEWTFQLRKGVTFHDGSPFTAKDVAYSYERLVKDKQSLQAPNLSDIKEVKAADDYTLVIVTQRPKVALLGLLYNRVILSQKAAERLGEKLDDQAIGTGPYRFAGWQRGAHLPCVETRNIGARRQAFVKLSGGRSRRTRPELRRSSLDRRISSIKCRFTKSTG